MAAPCDIVTFANTPPTAKEIAHQISNLTGLQVRVDQSKIKSKTEGFIAFEAIPEEKIELCAARDSEGRNVLDLEWQTAGRTLLFATRIVLESRGGSNIWKISDKKRRKYGKKITVNQLLRRRRWEQFSSIFLRPIGFAMGISLWTALFIYFLVTLPFHRQKPRRKTS